MFYTTCILWYACALTCLFLLSKCAYNVLFHPLRDYPGPLLCRATRLCHVFYDVRGLSHWKTKEWHDRYGPVVRIAPDELSYTNGKEAWPAIYGFPSKSGPGNFEKDARWWNKNVGGVDNILTADDAGHRRMRRLQNPAFSDKALRMQEGVLERYTSLLVHQLRREASGDEGPDSPGPATVDIMSWYHFLMFDLIGDLAFGEPFHCLRDARWHWWLRAVFDIFQAGTYIRAARRFAAPVYYLVLLLVIPRRLLRTRERQYQFGKARVDRRLQQETDRPDFMSYMTRADGERGMTVEELYTTAQVLIVAGSETTATALTAATYLLLRHPRAWRRLRGEVRGRFARDADITVRATAGLAYLGAVVDETLRLCPPGPGAFPRTVPPPGAVVAGRWVPGGYSVGVHHLATGRSARNFAEPESFVPERWLPGGGDGDGDGDGDDDDDDDDDVDRWGRFEDDQRSAMQAFSFGPRNCIGKNLALAEIKTILSRVAFNFDMELDPASAGWLDRQKMFTTWHKTEMRVKIVPRTSG